MAQQRQAQLIEALKSAHEAMRVVVARVDPKQEIYPTWTIKQVLAHIAGWDEASSASLKAYLEGDESTIPAYRGINDYNARSVETRSDLSYEHIVREWEIERERLRDLLSRVPEDKFFGEFLLPWSVRGTIDDMLAVIINHEHEHAVEINQLIDRALAGEALPGRPMKRAGLVSYCLSKKGAVSEQPFGPDVDVIKVMNKVFALIPVDSDPPRISLKCDPVLAEMLRETYPAVTPGYHLNKRHWNSVEVDGSVPEDEIREWIDHSYELVVKGLTRAEREQLDKRDA